MRRAWPQLLRCCALAAALQSTAPPRSLYVPRPLQYDPTADVDGVVLQRDAAAALAHALVAALHCLARGGCLADARGIFASAKISSDLGRYCLHPVSYTHLTLPTKA